MRFRDAHTHLAAGAVDLVDLDLRALAGDALIRAVASAAAERPNGRWIRGWGWDGTMPARSGALDRVAPGHPVFLARRDGHAAWLSASAGRTLEVAGELVVESAFDDARRRIPEPPWPERLAAVARQAEAFAAAGIDRVDDFVAPWAPEAYARLAGDGRLPLAVAMWLPETTATEDADALRSSFPSGRGRVSAAGIKIFLDGTLGARTAALFEPYADDPSTCGTLRVDERDIGERVLAWAGRGWPVAIHAIGDRAVAVALGALERAPRSEAGPHRIEHVQVIRRADLARFGRGGIVASVQPGHVHDDAAWWNARLGRRAEVIAYPLASLARAGATLLFGSDWPVSDFSPDRIVAAATDRARGDEALDRDQALARLAA